MSRDEDVMSSVQLKVVFYCEGTWNVVVETRRVENRKAPWFEV